MEGSSIGELWLQASVRACCAGLAASGLLQRWQEDSGDTVRVPKVYFHAKAFPFLFREIHVFALFPPISPSLGGDQNHKKVTGISERQIRLFVLLIHPHMLQRVL